MEKNIVTAILLSALLFANCEKKQPAPTNTSSTSALSYDALLVTLHDKTTVFISKQELAASNAFINWKLVKADFAGAAAGGAAGATIGGAIGGPGGAIGGAIGGGIAGAIIYTIEKANESSGNDLRTFPPLSNPNEGVKSNPSNPYEIVGATHNLVVNEILKNPEVILEGNQVSSKKVYDFSKPFIVAIPQVGSEYTSYFPVTAFDDVFSLFLQNTSKDLVAFLNDLEHDGRITELESDILHEYSAGLNRIKEVSDFQEYSIDIENTIIASNVPEKSKAIVLGFMSASRYSVAYWNTPR